MLVRTRFAPSPTGYLHIGGARTALYCWLYAHNQDGKFILRIEDTDLERSTPEAVQAIFDAMEWLQLNCDEGPFFQTKRFDRYAEVLQQLLQENKAYRCYCTKEHLEALRAQQTENKEKPRYDGRCRDLNNSVPDAPFVIRFRNPQTGTVIVDDQVRGPVSFDNSELDDLIIARTDGSPTYNFTVVVDDWDMKVTHVIRGDDHLNNTPRQINILKALGATLPIYAHVPMILGADGKKLSKRHGAVSVMQYRDEGYMREALLNYLIRLGWSHGDQEIFSREEMIQYFNLKNLSRSSAAFNPEKLLWLNQQYLKNSEANTIQEQLEFHIEHAQLDTSAGPALSDVIDIQRGRVKTLCELVQKSRFFYEPVTLEKELLSKHFTQELLPGLRLLLDNLTALSTWSDEAIHGVLQQVAEQSQLKLGQLAQPLRIAITGGTVSPPMDATLRVLGKEKSIKRLEQALKTC